MSRFEPCIMCAGAIVLARIRHLVYGIENPKAGAIRSLYQIGHDPRLNHQIEVSSGICAQDCREMMTSFFSAITSWRGTEVVITGPTRNRFGGQKLSRGFESHPSPPE